MLGTPNSNKDKIGKPKGHELCISVTAIPRFGRATDHMVKFLALEFGVKPSDITVVFGRFSIHKQLRVKTPAKLPAVFRK